FAAVAPLQPVAWSDGGLVCAPRAAPDLAGPALRRCPLPVRPVGEVPGWPAPPSDTVAGWYRRGPDHLPAPAGVREILQVDGPAFGAAGHETTALALAAIDMLEPGPAVDAGCGSGTLALAWATLGRGPVEAVDLDPDAVRQTADAARLTGLDGRLRVRRDALERVRVGDRVLLANLPPAAHLALRAAVTEPPRAAVLTGVRRGAGRDVADHYLRLGMRVRSVARLGRWERWLLVRP
ncbi:MAG: 50S ribosomal protein L11 methyltransferase, partial [Actinomycetota bacterium]